MTARKSRPSKAVPNRGVRIAIIVVKLRGDPKSVKTIGVHPLVADTVNDESVGTDTT